MGPGGPVPQGAPEGQVSGAQAEDIPVIIPESDSSGVRTLDDLSELLTGNEVYQLEEDQPSEGTYEESVTPGPGLRIVFKSNIEDEENWDIVPVCIIEREIKERD